jgi:hypothetical protein
MGQSTTATRLDVGIISKGVHGSDQLEPAAILNALFTCRGRVAEMADIDPELTRWLRAAYDDDA